MVDPDFLLERGSEKVCLRGTLKALRLSFDVGFNRIVHPTTSYTKYMMPAPGNIRGMVPKNRALARS